MTVKKQIDPEIIRILSATPDARCKVVITLTPIAENTKPEALALSSAKTIVGLPGLITAELTASDLTRLEQEEAVQAIDLDSEQQALA